MGMRIRCLNHICCLLAYLLASSSSYLPRFPVTAQDCTRRSILCWNCVVWSSLVWADLLQRRPRWAFLPPRGLVKHRPSIKAGRGNPTRLRHLATNPSCLLSCLGRRECGEAHIRKRTIRKWKEKTKKTNIQDGGGSEGEGNGGEGEKWEPWRHRPWETTTWEPHSGRRSLDHLVAFHVLLLWVLFRFPAFASWLAEGKPQCGCVAVAVHWLQEIREGHPRMDPIVPNHLPSLRGLG